MNHILRSKILHTSESYILRHWDDTGMTIPTTQQVLWNLDRWVTFKGKF